MQDPEEFGWTIEENDLLLEKKLLLIPQVLIDVCECVNKCTKRCECFRNWEKNIRSIASAVIRSAKTITIEKFTNIEPKVYFSFFDTTYLPLFCMLIEVS